MKRKQYVVDYAGTGHELAVRGLPDASMKMIGNTCRGGVHVQTFDVWNQGIGPGSAKWSGLACRCGKKFWSYVAAGPGNNVFIGQWVDRE